MKIDDETTDVLIGGYLSTDAAKDDYEAALAWCQAEAPGKAAELALQLERRAVGGRREPRTAYRCRRGRRPGRRTRSAGPGSRRSRVRSRGSDGREHRGVTARERGVNIDAQGLLHAILADELGQALRAERELDYALVRDDLRSCYFRAGHVRFVCGWERGVDPEE